MPITETNNWYLIAIGAYRNDDNGQNSGHCRIYEF